MRMLNHSGAHQTVVFQEPRKTISIIITTLQKEKEEDGHAHTLPIERSRHIVDTWNEHKVNPYT
jgi:hypothetical protein